MPCESGIQENLFESIQFDSKWEICTTSIETNHSTVQEELRLAIVTANRVTYNEQLALYRDVISCYTPNTVVMHLMRCETHGSKYQLSNQLNVYHLYHGFNW